MEVGSVNSVIFCKTCWKVVAVDEGNEIDVPTTSCIVETHLGDFSKRHDLERILAATGESVEYLGLMRRVYIQ